jgi:hypothetical protein
MKTYGGVDVFLTNTKLYQTSPVLKITVYVFNGINLAD